MRNSIKYLCLILFIGTGLFAQPYVYDFGDATGSHEADTSTIFLPQPSSGTARVRIGSGGGGFFLNNDDSLKNAILAMPKEARMTPNRDNGGNVSLANTVAPIATSIGASPRASG